MAFRDWVPDFLRRDQPLGLKDLASIGELPRGGRTIQGTSNQEFGASGTENFGGYIRKEDFNPELDDWQRSVAIYDKMRRTDSQIRAMLQVIKLPLRGATWTCQPPTTDPIDKRIADFCNAALFDDDAMEDSWDFTLRHILLQLDFGVSVLEKVWKVDEDGFYRFRRLAPRLPKTLREWHTNREGKLVAIVQYAPVPSSTMRMPSGAQRTPTYGTSVSYQYLTIPAEYAAVFTLEREGDNFEGYSLLRNIYRNYYFKDQAYHTLAVGLDRWGVGIPVAELEEGHTLLASDKETLQDILRSIRANERAYLVAPEHVRFKILPEGSSGTGTLASFGIQWIEHNDSQIAQNVLAGFLTMGHDPHGTLGFGSRLTDMFISSLFGIAAGINGDLKKQIIKPLCDLNFDMSRRQYPTPVCLDLEETNLSSLLDTLAKLTGTTITAQDEDEDVLRKMLGLPPLNEKNKRIQTEPKKEDTAIDAAAAKPSTPDVSAMPVGQVVGPDGQPIPPAVPGALPTPPAVVPTPEQQALLASVEALTAQVISLRKQIQG
jgi:hypothetical protein